MQEMIDCEDVTISINPQEPLPTLSAERCNNTHLYFYEPTAMGSIYTVQCSNLFVYFKPPHPERSQVELNDDNKQNVTKYSDGKLNTVEVVRGE